MMRSTSHRFISLRSRLALSRLWLPLFFCVISACTSLPKDDKSLSSLHKQKQLWVDSVLKHSNSLPNDYEHHRDQILKVSEEMRQEVIQRFGHLSNHSASSALAKWLIDEEGHNMRYDTDANLTPLQAFHEKRGNCLSFTLLLNALARELGIRMQYNAVEIPSSWNFDEEVGLIFYRHVNAVQRYGSRKQIFDLALELYNPGYPQKFITETEAVAMFMNNFSIMHLQKGEFEKASHFSKLGIAYSPNNADLWVNLGVVLKRSGKFKEAEFSFLRAYELSQRNLPAVSNLERLYRQQNEHQLAAIYAKRAKRARSKNPYLHYVKARHLFERQLYEGARNATDRAITLHGNDPRFYELKSRIAQAEGDYKTAVKSLKKAYSISEEINERERYASKVEIVRRYHHKSLLQ